tara:strand:+ start:532 stop:816 length:285 start_codon:yes stop_codon:yes gene_type:complete
VINLLINALPALVTALTKKDNIKSKSTLLAGIGAIGGGAHQLPVVAELIMKYKPIDHIAVDLLAWFFVVALCLNWKEYFKEVKNLKDFEMRKIK